MNTFEDLDVWKSAHALVLAVYKMTDSFPKAEQYRLVSQLCRASSSIAANIVEGHSRSYKKEFIQFLYIARGSLEETKYHILLARDLGYIHTVQYTKIIETADTTGRLLNGLLQYLKTHSHN